MKMKCTVHDCEYVWKDVERGKTVQVCPMCEEEDGQFLKEAFKDTPMFYENPVFRKLEDK